MYFFLYKSCLEKNGKDFLQIQWETRFTGAYNPKYGI